MPTIIKHPVSMAFRENSEQVSTLSCLANGLEPLNYHWQMYQSTNDSWTKPSVRAVNIKSPKLVFSKLTEEDEGIYRCIVFSEDDHVISNNATITLYGELIFCNITSYIAINFKLKTAMYHYHHQNNSYCVHHTCRFTVCILV